jgi:hypothetical protein
VLRAARSRRDGLVTGKGGGDERRRGGRGQRDGQGAERGAGRGNAGPGRARGPATREEYDAEAVRRASRPTGTYNPFASFFKGKKDEAPEETTPELPPTPAAEPPPEAQA